MGCSPKRIFIEMARGGEKEKKRTISRKQKVLDLYKSCKDDVREILSEIENYSEERFQSDKLYLYCIQQGKCMYSGDPIDLDQLLSGNSNWDIDHIYPQSKVKDDSLNNRVLANKILNGAKADKYPISSEIRMKMRGFWDKLLKHDLISKEKFDRLTRDREFDEKELAGFIARQLVETRQSTKAVASLLKEKYKDQSEIVYVKAGLVAEFRHKFEMLKCRDVNDLHHAKDAYLNIVTGNVHHLVYTSNPMTYIKENPQYSVNGLYERDRNRNGEEAWVKQGDKTISNVKSMMAKNNALCTRYAFCRKGGFFDQNPVSKGNGQLSMKADERMAIEKYGGYNNLTATYFILVKHTLNGKPCISIKPVDLVVSERFERDRGFAEAYCRNELRLENPEIVRKLKINTLLAMDGAKVAIASKSNGGETIVLGNSNQLIFDSAKEVYVKKLSSFVEKHKKNDKYTISPDFDKVYFEENEKLYDELYEKLLQPCYSNILNSQIKTLVAGKEKFKGLSIEEQCRVLMNIISLFKSGRTTGCNLKMIDGSGQGGVITLNACLSKTKYKSIKIIDQSTTGLFEKVSENLLEL